MYKTNLILVLNQVSNVKNLDFKIKITNLTIN